ncbi:hypothetical protein [Paenibacillus sp. XY044]|uniref:hypothetical protein n=1 Tax=Paenibacillus sp. XY044 TaxID=2026089 RepID=UPI000B99BB43|nr:hypothetical protein [Paenibacillus sp. XY044]OZB98052.1 hypothetical protein CJP46_02480 [Paenibacillus sp. XY044]
MIDSKIIMMIHNEKESIKQKQRQLLIKYGFGKHSRDIDKQITVSFFRMAEESQEDLNSFIDLEKEYVCCNSRLVSLRMSKREVLNSR